MMEMVKADVSSSETDTSAGEELNKSREMAIKVLASDQRNSVVKRKHRSWNSRRFWRAQNSNSSTQGSASDHETPENPSLTDSMMAQSESFSGRKGNRHLRLPCRTASASGRQASSTESLLSIIRNFSSTNHRTPSTPSSPKSDYDISSSFPTPLSTPGSPAGSLEALALTPHVTDSTTTIIQVILTQYSILLMVVHFYLQCSGSCYRYCTGAANKPDRWSNAEHAAHYSGDSFHQLWPIPVAHPRSPNTFTFPISHAGSHFKETRRHFRFIVAFQR